MKYDKKWAQRRPVKGRYSAFFQTKNAKLSWGEEKEGEYD